MNLKRNTFLVAVVCVAVIGIAYVMVYPVWIMLENCDAIAITENASSYEVTINARCILEFCESKSVDNKTFLSNCRHQIWKEK